jgi:hypothetical protein
MAAVSIGLATTAYAADLPVKAKPVEYVKVCSQYGEGFFYIPGTDSCLKIGMYLRAQASYNVVGGGIPVGAGSGFGAGLAATNGRLTRADLQTDMVARMALSTDWRTQTDYGVVRAYALMIFQQGLSDAGIPGSAPGSQGIAGLHRAFIQFAGFTVGHAVSYFDNFSYFGAYSYHYPSVSGETSPFGVDLIAYTWQFGNGISASISAEANDVGHYRAAVVDGSAAAFAVNAAVTGDTTLMRMPDIVGNLRYDQAWGFVGASGVLHDVSGAYYATGNNTINGHPDDKTGWALGVGGKLNLAGGDSLGANFVYSVGAAGYATKITNGMQIYDGNSVGVGWLTDGVFDSPGIVRTPIELTRVWSLVGAYEHVWTPQWRTSVFGGYTSVDYNANATAIINSHLPGAAGTVVCGVPVAGAVWPPVTLPAGGGGNSCNPDFSFYEVGTRTQWSPVPNLDIGVQVLYTHLNTAYKGPGVYGANAPQPATTSIDDQGIWSVILRIQRALLP